MEDFWSRQGNTQSESFEFDPFGHKAIITANRLDVLAAARLSAGRFSRAEGQHSDQPMRIQMVVRREQTGPVPADLPERLVYAGVDRWITVSAGEWGYGFANLDMWEALIFLSPALAADSRLVSRYFIDHYLLNFILTEWAMLHASCVLEPERQQLVVMIAPHNSGKSTTALHLLRAGYHFLADGTALFRRKPRGDGFVVGGYPIGEVKLRDDVLGLFPEYTGEAVRVREQRKTVVDLRAAHPGQLVQTLVTAPKIDLCLVERSGGMQTRIEPLSPEQVWGRLMANTVYWDEPARLATNNEALATLLQVASLHSLELGTDVAGIRGALERL
jgi:hypothetical protein